MSLVANLGESRGDLDAIRRIIASQLEPFFVQDKAAKEAKKIATERGEKVRGTRETILREIAKRAVLDNWSENDAHNVLDDIVKSYKNAKGAEAVKKSSLATFKTDLKLVLYADTRNRVNAVFDAAHNAIVEEKEAVKGLDKDASREERKAVAPVTTAFTRAYQAAIQAMKASRKSSNLKVDTVETLQAYAQAYIRDMKFDPERAAAKLSQIAALLGDFAEEYANATLAQCADFLRKNISESVLKEGWENAKKARTTDVETEDTEDAEDAEDTEDTEDTEDAALDDALTYAAPIAA